jgi:hypothetical protein
MVNLDRFWWEARCVTKNEPLRSRCIIKNDPLRTHTRKSQNKLKYEYLLTRPPNIKTKA